MRTADFDFEMPLELIAQSPAPVRDQSRLLVLDRGTGRLAHRSFGELGDYLYPGDVLVFNDSRVIPARLRGANARTGGRFEILLLEEIAVNDWWVMLRPGKAGRVGVQIAVHNRKGAPSGISATVREANAEGHRRLAFSGTGNIVEQLEELGEVPLPPYIVRHDPSETEPDRERYQTVFAGPAGSVAAPTAGLHFTEGLLESFRSRGIETCFLTLHIGLGTFAPVKAETLSNHIMHEERYELSAATARAINAAKAAGRRVVAVGTTSARVLESVAEGRGGGDKSKPHHAPPTVRAGIGRTRLFVYPPYDFKIVDAMVTNFHLPRSTLLMLVSAFAAPNQAQGRELILSAYTEAVRERYRFFSYGDAMLIL